MDFNLRTIETICHCLEVEMPTIKTTVFEKNPLSITDGRFLVDAKKGIPIQQEKYVQVFGDRHGFIENTSVLDLLFNEGNHALTYLQHQNTDFLNA